MIRWIDENKTALILASVALIIRIAYLIELSYQPDFLLPMVDEKFHWLWAEDILTNSFWGEGSYFRAPLYGYLLALLRWITSGSIFFTKFLQLFLCFGTSFFLVTTTKHLFNKQTSIIAGLIYAFYGTLIFYESMFLIPAIFLFFIMWGLYRIVLYRECPNFNSWLFTGIVFGLAAISRPNVLLIIPFFMLWLYLTKSNAKDFLTKAKLPLALLAGLLIVITPITIRNAIVTGEFILISSQGGINLYLGNNPNADGLTMLMPEVALDESVSWAEFESVTHTAAEKEASQKLTNSEASSFWSQKAVSFILDNPENFLRLVWQKSVYLVSGFENSDNGDIYYHRKKSKLFSLLLWDKVIYFPFGLLVPLALLGMYSSRKKFKQLMPLYIFFVIYIPSIVLFLVTARHRLPLLMVLIILASAGLFFLFENFKKYKSKKYLVGVGIFIFSLLIVNQKYYAQNNFGGDSWLFQIYFNEGIQFEKLQQFNQAVMSYKKADNIFPNSVTLLNNLGFVQYRLKQYSEAENSYMRAIHLDNSYAAAYNNFGKLLQNQNSMDSSLQLFNNALLLYKKENKQNYNISMIYANIANLYDVIDEKEQAGRMYSHALLQKLVYPLAIPRSAAFYAKHKMFTKSDSLYIVAEQKDILEASHFFNWGLSYVKRNQIDNALSKLHKCIEQDAQFYQAYHLIGYGMYTQNAQKDSVLYYLDKTLQINPNYRQAIELRKKLRNK